MKPFEQLEDNPMVSTLVDIICGRVNHIGRNFVTVQVCYHLTKIASMMRCTVNAQGYGKVLVNFYGINTAPSGAGKGHSNTILNEQVVQLFNRNFLEFTYPSIANTSLVELASKRSLRKGTDEQLELEEVVAEFNRLGAYLPSFDSGTVAAAKQFRHMLLMANVGSINFEVDEAGSKLVGNKEMLEAYLELFDGVIKPKLIKNTAESIRNAPIDGKTPTNMIMYGTLSTILDGGAVEKAFMDFLVAGYARRCFFGFSGVQATRAPMSVEERFKQLTDVSLEAKLTNIAQQLEKLADPSNYGREIYVPDDVLRAIIEYQMHCEGLLENIRASDEIRKAEARGRHWKTIRLAGAFAFIDQASAMTMAHWEAAVKIAEESAKDFTKLLSNDPSHARLAKYLAECPSPVTIADLLEELPYFPKASNPQKDMIKHAIAWGYRNNVIIKRQFIDDIEFIHGDSLKETDLSALRLSHSHDISEGYIGETKVPFHKLDLITLRPDWHWCNHHFIEGRRLQTHAIQGFNLIVIDVDGTATIEHARSVLKDYTYHIYTTKRHTPECHRFRIVLPMSHILKLSTEEYKAFMDNVLEYLPFETDDKTSQTNRKWLSNSNGTVYNNEGILFDVLPFIPKTRKSEEFKRYVEENSNLDALERFFYKSIGDGTNNNRNNTLARYAFALVDSGHELDAAINKLKDFNSKIPNPISMDELESTVIQSMTKKFLIKG